MAIVKHSVFGHAEFVKHLGNPEIHRVGTEKFKVDEIRLDEIRLDCIWIALALP